MATHSSATPRVEKSHIIDASLKRRARLLITNSSISGQTNPLSDPLCIGNKGPGPGPVGPTCRGRRNDYRPPTPGVTRETLGASLRLAVA